MQKDPLLECFLVEESFGVKRSGISLALAKTEARCGRGKNKSVGVVNNNDFWEVSFYENGEKGIFPEFLPVKWGIRNWTARRPGIFSKHLETIADPRFPFSPFLMGQSWFLLIRIII